MKESIKKRIEAVRRGEVPEGYRLENGYLISDDWKTTPLNSRFTRSTRKNSTGCENVLTISAQMGLVNQREFYDKDIASEDKSGYFLMKNGEFAYNKSYSTGYPYGAIKQLTKYDEGIVSPLYICFAPKAGTNTAFYTQYFEGGQYNREIYRVAQEGARNHGLLNVAVDDFFTGTLVEPSAGEQQKISEILEACDRMIELKQSKIDELKKLKQVCLLEIFPQKGQTIPKRRFPGFSAPWEQRKLGDVADIVGGGTPSTGNQSYWDGDIDWYAPAEIADQIYANSSQKKITGLGYENSSAKMLPPGTVLFTSRAGIGKTAILTRKGCTNQGFQSIVPHRGELDSYFIFSRTEELKRYGELVGAGSTFVEVSGKQMAVMELMMPPTMREQQTIGGFFQQLDHLITLHQRKFEKLTNVKKSMLEKMFPQNGSSYPEIRFKGFTDPWEQRKVGDLLIERNQQAPMSDEYPLMAFIANEGVAPKGERYDRSALVTDTVNKLYKKTEKGDFIYSSNNLETGSIGLNKYGKACISPVYSIFEPTGIADSDFLGRRLVRKDFINAMVKWRQGVIYGQWRIHESDFLKIEIPVPSVEEQRKIGAYLDQLDNLITLHQRELEKLKNLKKACLEKMFV